MSNIISFLYGLLAYADGRSNQLVLVNVLATIQEGRKEYKLDLSGNPEPDLPIAVVLTTDTGRMEFFLRNGASVENGVHTDATYHRKDDLGNIHTMTIWRK